jgi:hypothetical protein
MVLIVPESRYLPGTYLGAWTSTANAVRTRDTCEADGGLGASLE